jgi:hypothetical protein
MDKSNISQHQLDEILYQTITTKSICTRMEYSPKCINYRIFKTNFGLEYYLLNLPKNLRFFKTKLRICNHRLPIETGRWNNIERNLRKCKECNSNLFSIGHEFHYILECTFFFSDDRKMYLNTIFYKYPNTLKFN